MLESTTLVPMVCDDNKDISAGIMSNIPKGRYRKYTQGLLNIEPALPKADKELVLRTQISFVFVFEKLLASLCEMIHLASYIWNITFCSIFRVQSVITYGS